MSHLNFFGGKNLALKRLYLMQFALVKLNTKILNYFNGGNVDEDGPGIWEEGSRG